MSRWSVEQRAPVRRLSGLLAALWLGGAGTAARAELPAVVCPLGEPALQAAWEPPSSAPAAAGASAGASPGASASAPALARVQLRWAVPGEPITVDRHLVMRVSLCPADARLLRVDAVMPAHGHGMNYRPSLVPLGGGHWRVQGMLLHMPGNWELRFQVSWGGRTLTLRDSIQLP